MINEALIFKSKSRFFMKLLVGCDNNNNFWALASVYLFKLCHCQSQSQKSNCIVLCAKLKQKMGPKPQTIDLRKKKKAASGNDDFSDEGDELLSQAVSFNC